MTYHLIVLGDGLPPTLPDVWVVSQDIIYDHPEQDEGVLSAMYRATRYTQDNRDYSIDFLR